MAEKLISFDYAIKYLLKDKSNYDIIESFISVLLKEQGYKAIKIIGLLDTESNKEEAIHKKSLADLIVEDDEHHKYIIEVERQEVDNFVHKACFNTSRLIVDHMNKGDTYLNIQKVFHISLLYFKIGNAPIYHGKTIVCETETKEPLTVHLKATDGQTYDAINIFPEYIFISVPQFDNHLRKEIDEWLYVMKNEEIKPEFKSPVMHKLQERLNILRMTTDERSEYLNYIKKVATDSNSLTLKYEKGLEQGRQEGKTERTLEIAHKMLMANIDINQISEVTGLSLEEINALK